MSSINKVILIGNLGNDPDIRYTTDQKAIANISLATSESWTDKQSGNREERTEWHRVVFFNRLAEIVGEYVKKGSKIYVEGQLRTRKWTDQSGVEKYTTEIVAREMKMLDSKASSSHEQHQKARAPQGKASSPQQNQQRQQQQAPSGSDEFDDDIPF